MTFEDNPKPKLEIDMTFKDTLIRNSHRSGIQQSSTQGRTFKGIQKPK